MSKKNLLNESQIRQFMKLASLEPLTPGFVRGLAENSASEEELEEVRNGSPAPGLDSARRGHGRGRGPEDRLEEEEVVDDLETEIGDDMAAAELDVEEPVEMEPEGDEGRLIAVDDFLAALESALEDVMGDEVEIDADDLEAEVEDEEEVEVDAELDVIGDEEELQEGGDKKGDEPADDLDYEKNESAEATDELVEQVTKRVAARILKSALSKK
tara:strand:- start:129 stop:770 length:642 start_codon:yes stop_codon:yes gene_type:complete